MANSEEMKAGLGRLETTALAIGRDVGDLKTTVTTLQRDMADVKRDVADLKTAAWQTTEILVDHSAQLTSLQRTVDERLGGVNDRLDRLLST